MVRKIVAMEILFFVECSRRTVVMVRKLVSCELPERKLKQIGTCVGALFILLYPTTVQENIYREECGWTTCSCSHEYCLVRSDLCPQDKHRSLLIEQHALHGRWRSRGHLSRDSTRNRGAFRRREVVVVRVRKMVEAEMREMLRRFSVAGNKKVPEDDADRIETAAVRYTPCSRPCVCRA